jgi:hypothetical protein
MSLTSSRDGSHACIAARGDDERVVAELSTIQEIHHLVALTHAHLRRGGVSQFP